MKRSIKAALAASAAGVLLVGGAGSLAYWNDSTTVPGGGINSGTLELSDASCGDGWTLDSGENVAGEPYSPTDHLVPGDVISKVCTFTVDANGDHLRATLAVTGGGFTESNALTADLPVVATYTIGQTAMPAEITEANDGDTVTATIQVTFKNTSTNATRNLAAVLDDVTITAQQAYS